MEPPLANVYTFLEIARMVLVNGRIDWESLNLSEEEIARLGEEINEYMSS
ncbi:MAG TPA: hypothetical protein VKT75_17400 [Acidobacteriaceae bacterium]|nr:hypothetical protein [Acidobacteriaceae bacterium]